MRTPGASVGVPWLPVPLRVTVAVDPDDALLVSVRLPVAAPAAVGLNWTLTLRFPPPGIVTGRLGGEARKELAAHVNLRDLHRILTTV